MKDVFEGGENKLQLNSKNVLFILLVIFFLGIILFINRSYNGEQYKIEYNDQTSINDCIIINTYNDFLKFYEMLDKLSDTIYFKDSITKNNNEKGRLLEKCNKDFFEKNSLVVINYLSMGSPNLDTRIVSVSMKETSMNVKLYVNSSGVTADSRGDVYIIPIKNKNIKSINYTVSNTNTMTIINALLISSPFVILGISIYRWIENKKKINYEINNEEEKQKLKKKNNIKFILCIIGAIIWLWLLESIYYITNNVAYKPIIYLYPTQEQNVSVRLGRQDKITCSYPRYSNGWNVLARPDGTLKDLSSNRQLYSLYYECKNIMNFKVENEGFVVKGEDTITFLEEKLDILGLTEREAEEFIIYWLPKLEANKYNYIRFATIDEINANMPLEINPHPDTIIRVLMIFKGLDNPIEIQEQQLITPERNGFVSVEWGGTEIE